MEILLNDQIMLVHESCSVSELMATLQLDSTKGIAVAINNKVIPRVLWSQQNFEKGDKVLIIKATQGG